MLDSKMAQVVKKLKPASTLMISCKTPRVGSKFDYKVMLLKRSSKMRVAPGFHVFPGGGYDANDESSNWLKVLLDQPGNLNLLRNSYQKIITVNSLSRLVKDAESESKLPTEISFRLCAIRETFEETGLLLARTRNFQVHHPKQWVSFHESGSLDAWQDKVRKDSSQFLNMCLQLDVVPDLYGLHEWANWVTPVHEKFRFNTFFFTCFLNRNLEESNFRLDSNEIETLNVTISFKDIQILFLFSVIFSMKRLSFIRLKKL
jgi:nucleoside diphosphate-linked moiety X motif protein 19